MAENVDKTSLSKEEGSKTDNVSTLGEKRNKVCGGISRKKECEPVNNEEEELFCICRSPDIDRFMIACDKCMEWFHGDCVNIENKRAAKKIEEWYCQSCLDKHTSLHIVYRVKKLKDYKKLDKKPLDSKNEKQREREEKQGSKREEHKNDDAKMKKKKKKRALDDDFIDDDGDGDGESERKHRKMENNKRSTRSCGECVSCTNREDCGDCDFCVDMKKNGGPGKLRQKCRARQCVFLSRVRKKDLEAIEAKISDKQDNNKDEDGVSIVRTVVKEHEHMKTTSNQNSKINKSNLDSLLQVINEEESKQFASTQQDHCYSAPCRKSEDMTLKTEHVTEKKKALKVKRATGKKVEFSGSKNNSKKSLSKKQDNLCILQQYGTKRVTRSSRKEKETLERRQCLGPGCLKASRSNSKYCSNECGIQLQIRRLQVILPARRKDGVTTDDYHATKLAQEKILEVRKVQKKCQEKLFELDQQYKALEELMEKSKGLTVLEEEQNEEEKDSDLDLTSYCVSCGIPLAPRIAFKHMEKCWAKIECLMSFGAVMRSAGNLFCDTYMSVQGTYCKRLKVMCPEHYKESKAEADSICGCPLAENEYCRVITRKCARHVAWRRLRRGEIDLRRVHQWWKLEDALEQERVLRIEISRRHNVLSVLLNHTHDHASDGASLLREESKPAADCLISNV